MDIHSAVQESAESAIQYGIWVGVTRGASGEMQVRLFDTRQDQIIVPHWTSIRDDQELAH